MKKVLALVLAVMMVTTTAFAAVKYATIAPSTSIKFSEAGIVVNKYGDAGVTELNVVGTSAGAPGVSYKTVGGVLVNKVTGKPAAQDSGDNVLDETGLMNAYASIYSKAELKDLKAEKKAAYDALVKDKEELQAKIEKEKDDDKKADLEDQMKDLVKDCGLAWKEWQAASKAYDQVAAGGAGTNKLIQTVGDMIFRSVTNENYTVSSFKVATGKAYVKDVTISDADEQVKVNFVKDLDNVTPKMFDLSFTLKGKGKMMIRSVDELAKYTEYVGPNTKKVKDTATIPSVKFQMSGTVCYGKVDVKLGVYTDEDLDGLNGRPTTGGGKAIDIDDDVIKFSRGTTFGVAERTAQAGAFVADAILTEEYDDGLTLEARVYSGDTLYFGVDYAPHPVIDQLDTGDGDVDFYFFHEDTRYTTLNTNARLIFNETEEGDHVYSWKNGKLTEVGEYDEDEGCIVVKARTLGQYITSNTELSWLDIAGSDDVANPDTGANDVVGIAAALAAVALVSAAAVSLKK